MLGAEKQTVQTQNQRTKSSDKERKVGIQRENLNQHEKIQRQRNTKKVTGGFTV